MRTRTRISYVLLRDEVFLDPKSHFPESSIVVLSAGGHDYLQQVAHDQGDGIHLLRLLLHLRVPEPRRHLQVRLPFPKY